jgi:insertion element IS1 protein InsB
VSQNIINAKSNCQYCNSVCHKTGVQKNGNQKLRCKNCKKYQLQSYSNNACLQETKQMIIKLCKVNVGIRDIGKLLEISVNSVIKKIKQGNSIKRNSILLTNQTYEVDEMRTYVGNKKNTKWIVYAINKKTKQVIDIAVGNRTKSTLKKVTDTLLLSSPKAIYSDGLNIYQHLIPAAIHKVQAYNINYIERMNLTLRTKLKRLNRKTICYSKKSSMLLAALKILVWG